MTVESFETIMRRNNTTLLAAHRSASKGCKDVAANGGGKAPRKNNTAMIAAALSLVLCFCLLSTAGAASVHKRRAIAPVTEPITGPIKTCHQSTPCGWAIYIPFSRRIDYFMKNTCECNQNLACLKTDDDLSVNAYVYRCKPRPPSTTTDNVPTTI